MNLLFTSSGRRAYLLRYFKNVMKENGSIHACNSSDLVSSRLVADFFIKSPSIYSQDYIDFLLNYCLQNEIDALIPLFDIDVPVIAQNKSKFKKIGVVPIVPEKEIAELCNDKFRSATFFEKNKVGYPKCFIDLNLAKAAILSGEFNFPCIVKPRWGMGSIGVYKAESIEDLEFFYNYCHRKVHQSYLRYESARDSQNSVLIQEFIVGTEYGLDLINDLNGNYQTVFIKEKVAMRSGETDISITRDNPEVKEFGRQLSSILKHPGIVDVDIVKNSNGIYVIDLNARFGGGYPFSHLAGANIPKAIICWLENKFPPEDCFNIKFNVTGIKDIFPVKI